MQDTAACFSLCLSCMHGVYTGMCSVYGVLPREVMAGVPYYERTDLQCNTVLIKKSCAVSATLHTLLNNQPGWKDWQAIVTRTLGIRSMRWNCMDMSVLQPAGAGYGVTGAAMQ